MTLLDCAVLAVYFFGILAAGLWFGRRERDTNDYFLGGRSQHWLLAGISIVATEVSALTLVAVPAESFWGNWNYLQMYFGSFVGRVLILFLLLPAFYGGAVTTVYQYLGRRFGPATQTVAASMFFVSRLLGSSIRLLLGSMSLSIVFGWPLWLVLVGSAAITIAYTTAGGIRAIMWTDLFQALIFVGGAMVVVFFVAWVTPGNAADAIVECYQSGKLRVFNFDLHLNNDKAFLVLFTHAIVQNMAALGCDQDLTQRMLTCRNLHQGQKSLLFNAVVGFPIVCLFLSVGVMLHIYFRVHGLGSLPPEIEKHEDRVFPIFMAHELPSGLRGLLVTAVFAATMSSLASAIGALSSSFVTDFYRPIAERVRSAAGMSESHFLRIARMASVGFGVILIAAALAFSSRDKLLWEAFKWSSLLFGGMLGVFLLGVTTRHRGDDIMNVVAMVTSVILLAGIKAAQERFGAVWIAWPWWVVIGTAWTYILGGCFRSRRSVASVEADGSTVVERGPSFLLPNKG